MLLNTIAIITLLWYTLLYIGGIQMKNKIIWLSVLLVIPLIVLSFVFTRCSSGNKKEQIGLSSVLSKLQDKTGNFKITGIGNLDNNELNYHRNVELIYKVNSVGSYAYDKNKNLHDNTENWYNEWYFSNDSNKAYHRSRTESSVWGKCSYQTTTNKNAFLSDADFRQLSEDMFSNEEHNVYVLKDTVTLSPLWDGWINTLSYLKIKAKENGASVVFRGSGNINTDTIVNAEFNFEIEYNQGSFNPPDWAYEPKIYNTTIYKTGQGSVAGSGNYEEDSEVTITATASDNYYFYGWQIGNQLITQSTYTFNMPSNNLTISAIFYEKQQYTITLSKTDGGWVNGSMVLTTMQTTKSSSFHVDEVVNLQANPSSGYTFAGWYVEGKFFSSETTLSFYMIEYDMHIEAKFFENSATINPPQDTYYSIEVLPTGANGSVSCGITRAKIGTQIIMTATPYLNLTKFDGWYYNGRLLSTNTTYTFTMPANNVIIYARFSSK